MSCSFRCTLLLLPFEDELDAAAVMKGEIDGSSDLESLGESDDGDDGAALCDDGGVAAVAALSSRSRSPARKCRCSEY